MTKLRLGTRGSKLALAQAHHVTDLIKDSDATVEIEVCVVRTKGDVLRDVPLSQVKGQGFFVKEIESALANREVDLAVHSCKDLPTRVAEGLVVAAMPPRHDPRDCLVSRAGDSLATLPRGSTVATSALRRRALIACLRPDLARAELRGNVDTRIRKLEEGLFDAFVVARAALDRLGWQDRACETFDTERFLPAVAQGALAVEVRASDTELRALLQGINHEPTAITVEVERTLLDALHGGCQVPVGAHCVQVDDSARGLRVSACVAAPDGESRVDVKDMEGSPEDPRGLGFRAARALLSKGAQSILDKVRRS